MAPVLVTGPTGSGKSTTLYAALTALNSVEKNVITIEDPVEYQIDGVNQINVNAKAGLTFASGLRSILRADPDVIMVGEIRDAETARIAIEAALTGHLVLSTLHTNDAPGTITRLQKMGIESFLTASAIDCIVAQRLARTLCPNCKRRAVVPPTSFAEAGFRTASGMEAYEAVGCSRCGNTGYRGRIGLYSVMRMSERVKDMTVNHASQAEIANVGPAGGDAHPARGRPRQGARRTDQLRRGREGDRMMNEASAHFDFAAVLTHVAETKASDLHLTAGFPPAVRTAGKIQAMEGFPTLTPQHTREVIYGILSEDPAQTLRDRASARLRLRDPERRPPSASTPTCSAARSAPPSAWCRAASRPWRT